MSSKNSCFTCGGKGTVVRWYKDSNGKWHKTEETCSACGGSGTK